MTFKLRYSIFFLKLNIAKFFSFHDILSHFFINQPLENIFFTICIYNNFYSPSHDVSIPFFFKFLFEFFFSPQQQQKSLERFSNRYYFRRQRSAQLLWGTGGQALLQIFCTGTFFLHIKKKLIENFSRKKDRQK